MDDPLISWLLEADVAIQYQVHRDLLGIDRPDLQSRIANEGWGKAFLDRQRAKGHWGKRFYEPKWISSHYTILDLKNLQLPPDTTEVCSYLQKVLDTEKSYDGGINLSSEGIKKSDVCVNGMFLNYASYFHMKETDLVSIVDALIDEKMPDGGFNCQSNRSKPTHSSMHSTISVLEGITEYTRNGYHYRLDELQRAKAAGIEFILLHKLFLSDRTGRMIKKDFLRLPYPSRWKYDILRALDYFQYAEVPWDDRMHPAIDVLTKKRGKDGKWKLNAPYPGQTHFVMEKAGEPSRWNTLRALRCLKYFDMDQ